MTKGSGRPIQRRVPVVADQPGLARKCLTQLHRLPIPCSQQSRVTVAFRYLQHAVTAFSIVASGLVTVGAGLAVSPQRRSACTFRFRNHRMGSR